MSKMRASEHPKEANLMIAILATVVGFYAAVMQSAGHLVFGRIHGAQAIGFGVISLCFGLFSLRLYLQPCVKISKQLRGHSVALLILYCVSLAMLFVRAGAGTASLRSMTLLATLAAGHAFHHRVIRALRQAEQAKGE